MSYLQKATLAILTVATISYSAIPTIGMPNKPAPSRSAKPAAPTSGWQNFRSPTGRFSVSVPAQPVASVANKGTADEIHSFRVQQSGTLLDVSYFEAASPAEAVQMAENMPQAIVKAFGAKMLREEKITIKNNPGKEYEFISTKDGATLKGTGRIYAVGKRVYLLMGIASQEQDVKQFLSSFNLI